MREILYTYISFFSNALLITLCATWKIRRWGAHATRCQQQISWNRCDIRVLRCTRDRTLRSRPLFRSRCVGRVSGRNLRVSNKRNGRNSWKFASPRGVLILDQLLREYTLMVLYSRLSTAHVRERVREKAWGREWGTMLSRGCIHSGRYSFAAVAFAIPPDATSCRQQPVIR